MIWHTGIQKNSLCYFAESNAKALLTQVSKVHCTLRGSRCRKRILQTQFTYAIIPSLTLKEMQNGAIP